MSHRGSPGYQFFPLNVQLLEENFKGKVVPIVKANSKLL